MRYALLIYENPGSYDGFSDERRQAVTAEYLALRDEPGVTGGGRLQSVETATSVRLRAGETLVADGPFADTKEVGGWHLLDAGDLDAAIDIAARMPAARLGGVVEIRPLAALPR